MPGETAKAIEDLQRELRAELRGIKESMHDVAQLKHNIEELLKENLERRVENAKLSRRLRELEPYQSSNNLEIKGVALDGEPSTVIKKIREIVHEDVTDADIDICHRVPTSRHNESNIIVRFVRRAKRNAVLSKAEKVRMSLKS